MGEQDVAASLNALRCRCDQDRARGALWQGGGGGASGTQKFVYQKCPTEKRPFICSHSMNSGEGEGRGSRTGGGMPKPILCFRPRHAFVQMDVTAARKEGCSTRGAGGCSTGGAPRNGCENLPHKEPTGSWLHCYSKKQKSKTRMHSRHSQRPTTSNVS